MRTSQQAPDELDLLEAVIAAIRADRQRLNTLEARQEEQASQQQALTARLDGVEGEYGWFTALGFAKLRYLPTDRQYLSRVGRRATALMRATGQQPARREDATFGVINVYPTAMLEQAFKEVAHP